MNYYEYPNDAVFQLNKCSFPNSNLFHLDPDVVDDDDGFDLSRRHHFPEQNLVQPVHLCTCNLIHHHHLRLQHSSCAGVLHIAGGDCYSSRDRHGIRSSDVEELNVSEKTPAVKVKCIDKVELVVVVAVVEEEYVLRMMSLRSILGILEALLDLPCYLLECSLLLLLVVVDNI
ncbi:hypothetical protein L195_g048431 [Trifolium pratense]|uniref:Uncharacterized protein n=1 Tax=Trifolium pratense TaxID=57577 RepID=A0A2K3JL96_TRIPR|nr:hypothetical protein L195_g048431 [Trifolium pratense]